MFKTIKIEEPSKDDDEFIYVTEYEVTSTQDFLLKIPTALACILVGIAFGFVALCSNTWMLTVVNPNMVLSSGLMTGCVQNATSPACLITYRFNGKGIILILVYLVFSLSVHKLGYYVSAGSYSCLFAGIFGVVGSILTFLEIELSRFVLEGAKNFMPGYKDEKSGKNVKSSQLIQRAKTAIKFGKPKREIEFI